MVLADSGSNSWGDVFSRDASIVLPTQASVGNFSMYCWKLKEWGWFSSTQIGNQKMSCLAVEMETWSGKRPRSGWSKLSSRLEGKCASNHLIPPCTPHWSPRPPPNWSLHRPNNSPREASKQILRIYILYCAMSQQMKRAKNHDVWKMNHLHQTLRKRQTWWVQ